MTLDVGDEDAEPLEAEAKESTDSEELKEEKPERELEIEEMELEREWVELAEWVERDDVDRGTIGN